MQHDDGTAKPLRILGGHLDATGIRGNNSYTGGKLVAKYVAERRNCRQTVNRDVKKSFNLGRVKVQGYNMLNADRLQQVGHHAGGDGFSLTMPLIGARIAEVRDNSRNASGRGTSTGVNEDQKLDQMFIDRRTERLHDEHFSSAHRFEKTD
jgi:hypothetical protein